LDPYLIGVFAFIHAAYHLNAIANGIWFHRKALRKESVSALPSISVLVPARNEEGNLPRLVRSFQAQNHPDAELIVYDDLSEDATWTIIQQFQSNRISGIKGSELPQGWVGKVHACYQLSLSATGRVFLFLDADTEFLSPSALKRMCERFAHRPDSTILTGMTLLRGKGQLIVSMVGNLILSAIPWWLEKRVPFAFLSGVNGQCWMIEKTDYRKFEPHLHVKGEVLEDIKIGRYLHGKGLVPVLDDVRKDVAVYMYTGFFDAWKGFQKNISSMLGNSALSSLAVLTIYAAVFCYAPFVNIWFLVSMYVLKNTTDRITHQPWLVTLLTPLSHLLTILISLDSIIKRSRGRIQWKGRIIGASNE